MSFHSKCSSSVKLRQHSDITAVMTKTLRKNQTNQKLISTAMFTSTQTDASELTFWNRTKTVIIK